CARETGNAGKTPWISRSTVENRLFFIFFMTACAEIAGYSENPLGFNDPEEAGEHSRRRGARRGGMMSLTGPPP
ncbi:MAG: hypothetical protein KA603_13765, partial [Azonexus sp.]|nr:hypothetical protein [Azonexus sp.]MBP6907774.1 hypothetical protein [Azonexus sp.]